MDIKLLRQEEIDKTKWNSCIHYANNGNIFGYKWYLDYVAKEWDALVEGDYESVMPIVWKTNRTEIYQPYFMRELGLYSIRVISEKRLDEFISAIPSSYQKVEMVLNFQNIPPTDRGFDIITHENNLLYLNDTYEALQNQYDGHIKAALAVSEEEGLVPTSNLKPEKIADFYKKHAKTSGSIQKEFYALLRIMYNALHRGWGFATGVLDVSGDLLAANFFLYSHGKVISLMPVASKKGQQTGALIFLLDLLIRSHANRPLILDFNQLASDKISKGFGGESYKYYQIKKSKNKKFWNIF